MLSSISTKFGANGYMILAGRGDQTYRLPLIEAMTIDMCAAPEKALI